MKTIIRAARPEKVQFNCDVTSVPLEHGPAATIKLHCGYGAPYDGDTFVFDLSMKAADVVIPLLRSLILDGGPLGPHLTESLLPAFRPDPDKETRISRRQRTQLLRELDKLLRHRGRAGDRTSIRPEASTGPQKVKTTKKGKGRRVRTLLPEYAAMMAMAATNDVSADLDAVRGNR